MRLKSFTAPTMKQAIRMVRDELGPDAVIVSTVHGRGNGSDVRITAAVEPRESPAQAPASDAAHRNKSGTSTRGLERTLESVRCALEDHGTPEPITSRIVAAARVLKGEEPRLALAAALDDCFRFAPIPEQDHARPYILVGPPGAGKTVTVAKLAARARLKGEAVTVLATDTAKAGGVEQIANLSRLMQANFREAANPAELAKAVGDCNIGELVLIDTTGINPYSESDTEALASLIAVAKAEPILVLNAGGDAREYADTAAAFAALGATRLIATRLDMARRLGSLLAAADSGRLRFTNVSATPHIGKGLTALNPVSLARLLLPEAIAAIDSVEKKERIA